jgi:hypothetical protein
VLAGNQLARWFGVAVLGLNTIDMMFFIPAYLFWALVILAADVVALWGVRLWQPREPWKPPNREQAGHNWEPEVRQAAPTAPPGGVRGPGAWFRRLLALAA